VHYDLGVKALKDGGVYRDDIGQCWPPAAVDHDARVADRRIQLPTAIYMVSGFMNSLRVIYLDGRPHTDPDLVVRSFNGESIGGGTAMRLVVDTKYFPAIIHWMDQGGASSRPARTLHIIERFRMRADGASTSSTTMTDPKNWEGDGRW
jgi:hypothetical protein